MLHLAFVVQPSNGKANHAIKPAIEVGVLNGSGQVVTSATGEVRISLGHKPDGQAALKGDNTQKLASGIATFGDLKVDGSGAGFTLVASVDGVGSVESNPFQIAD